MAINLTNPMSGDTFKTEIEKALDKTGDSMNEGASLKLGKMPEEDMEAVPKSYVDTAVKNVFKSVKILNAKCHRWTVPTTAEKTFIGDERYLIGKIPNFNPTEYVFMGSSLLRVKSSPYIGLASGEIPPSSVPHNNDMYTYYRIVLTPNGNIYGAYYYSIGYSPYGTDNTDNYEGEIEGYEYYYNVSSIDFMIVEKTEEIIINGDE